MKNQSSLIRLLSIAAVGTTVLITVAFAFASTASAIDWSRFRGEGGTGYAPSASLPTELGSQSAVAWKADLPGKGPSSPIVVGDKVFVTASGGPDQEWMSVLCFDSKSGERLWMRRFWPTGRPNSHSDSANAAPTPVSDGKHIYAFFSSNDLACLDLDGNLVWFRGLAFDYPKAGNDTGMASSPAIWGDAVFVQVENQADSFAAAINKHTGETLWRIKRTPKVTWASPVVVPGEGKHPDMVIMQSRGSVSGIHVDTGEELWKIEGDVHTTASASYRNGIAYVPVDGMTALKFDAVGNAETIWNESGMRSGGASAVVTDDHIYIRASNGVVTQYDIKTGKSDWKIRVGESQVWSTPVANKDFLFCFDMDGTAHVVKLGDEPEVISSAKLSDRFQCSPAISDKSSGNDTDGQAIFIRSNNQLIKIAG